MKTLLGLFLFSALLLPSVSIAYDIESEADAIEAEIQSAQEPLEGEDRIRYLFNELGFRAGYEVSNRDAEVFSGKIHFAHYITDYFALGVRYASYKMSSHRVDTVVTTEQRAAYEILTQYIFGDSVIYPFGKKFYAEWIARLTVGKTSFSNDQDEDLATAGIDMQIFLSPTVSGTLFYELEASPLWSSEKTSYRSLIGLGLGWHF